MFQITPVKICDFDLASGLDGLSATVTTPELQTPVIIQFAEIKVLVSIFKHGFDHPIFFVTR